ncbi:hypothetical protein [Algoriphagus sp. CAU 1675]|uniref:hypothetical protein n=1 Tax=Algoriphagus sp. CAU 1675 TaxID=3032597 RepID=UPI0023DA6B0D|nr:hypothetical protein [Algoriphagus sp. CAU 1675]MDF2156694.1 hypothetical protein [Algoriphagus sp. CAU 1675]
MNPKNPNLWVWFIALIGALLYIQTLGYGYSADDGIYAYFNRVTQKGLEELDRALSLWLYELHFSGGIQYQHL